MNAAVADLLLSGHKLRARRLALGMTQRSLAIAARVSRESVETWEQAGFGNPSLRIFGRLMRALDCELEDLVEG